MTDGTENLVRVSYRDIVWQVRRFVLTSFAISWVLAAFLAFIYYRGSVNPDKFLYTLAIVAMVGFSMPIMSVVTRVSIKAYLLGVEQAERLSTIVGAFQAAYEKAPNLIKNVEAVMDKALPIANNVEEIVTRAKVIAGDIETVSHKVRTTMDGLNGALDAKVIEARFKEIGDSLKTISSAFSIPEKVS